MKFNLATSLLSVVFLGVDTTTTAFVNTQLSQQKALFTSPYATSTTSLNAIGVLARKAKEMSIKQLLESNELDSSITDLMNSLSSSEKKTTLSDKPLQTALTKRRGTITIIPEYKRRLDKFPFIDEIYDIEIMSPNFREFGATAVSVMADERIGGCTYSDIESVVKEQEIAKGDVPGPLFVISSDLIVHPVQVCQSKLSGASCVLLNYGLLGKEKAVELAQNAFSLDMEVIMSVSTEEEAQSAYEDCGVTMLMINVADSASAPECVSILDSVETSEDDKICKIANVLTRDDKGMQEIEDAWVCRDKGFQSVWASDFLYKAGNDSVEHPGAIINSMRAKASVKWASVKARGGKGEGAKEYLGDIMM